MSVGSRSCAWTDEMIAFFLDGAPERQRAGDRVDARALDQHRRDCDACALALGTARRLDALVATTASTQPSVEVIDRWFDAVALADAAQSKVVEIEDETENGEGLGSPIAMARARRRWGAMAHRLSLAAALLLIVVSLAVTILDRAAFVPATARPRPADDATAAVSIARVDARAAAASRLDPSLEPQSLQQSESSDKALAIETGPFVSKPGAPAVIFLPAARRPRPRPPDDSVPHVQDEASLQWFNTHDRSSAVAARAAALRRNALERGSLLLHAWGRSAAWGVARGRDRLVEDARSAGVARRLARLDEFLDRRIFDGAIQMVAAWPVMAFADEGLSSAAQRLRGVREVEDRLANEVARGDGDAWRVAVLVGGTRIDDLLIRGARGDRSRGDRVARVLASVDGRPGRVWLLLRLWTGAYARGAVANDFDAAYRWFSAQPRDCTPELLSILASSRNATLRRMCLLALAAREDPAAFGVLVGLLDGDRQDEAVLAAFALGRVAAGSDGLVGHVSGREHLRCAALAGRCDLALADCIERLDLSAVDRSFLLAGHFDEYAFAVAAELFRKSEVQPGAVDAQDAHEQD